MHEFPQTLGEKIVKAAKVCVEKGLGLCEPHCKGSRPKQIKQTARAGCTARPRSNLNE